MAGVDLLFGPMLIGVLLNVALYGVMATQMLTYYKRYANDFVWFRYFMLYLFVVESALVIVQIGIIFQPLIIDYGALKALVFAPKNSFLIVTVAAPVQMFAAWRMKVITESYIIPAVVSLLSLASGSSGILLFLMVLRTPQFRDFGSFTTVATLWLAGSATCDILIAGGMSYALVRPASQRSRTKARKTKAGDSLVGHTNRIVCLTIETGLLTAIFALVNVMLFLVFPLTPIYRNFIAAFPLSNLYICSVLAMYIDFAHSPDRASHQAANGNFFRFNSREPKRVEDVGATMSLVEV
ncbi:hypothetical protein GGX14DRAFT_466415 [Mycena pura]|uniref:DUF6534 domain-containing protein n=1 Tax=Mycena pura TaxID=153505 RepID=A0AAD6V1T1_9AGAR|nr:hypothetical protein GGX14DRAFT_466415 [Mycena pura]